MTEQEYKKYIYDKANEVKNKKDLDKLLREVIKSKDLDYGKSFTDNKWKCARKHIWSGNYKCVFSYSDTAKECAEIIDRWINANKDKN